MRHTVPAGAAGSWAGVEMTCNGASSALVDVAREFRPRLLAERDRIEAERDYVRLYWEGRTLLHRETMSHLEEKLDPNVMLRVHRSAFVNWKRLSSVRRDANGRLMAVLNSGDEVPVSRAYAQRVMTEVKTRS